jgi:antitoxin component YwqK of YwqJK toxin-antitoxin module
MKKYFISATIMVSAIISAQSVQPKLEAEGQLVKATYYYENGQVSQQGFFKDGKPEGSWVAYDLSGNKKSIGEYSQGQKSGKWFFWNDATLSEVDYTNSRIAAVKSWKQDAVANRN